MNLFWGIQSYISMKTKYKPNKKARKTNKGEKSISLPTFMKLISVLITCQITQTHHHITLGRVRKSTLLFFPIYLLFSWQAFADHQLNSIYC